MLAPAAEEQKMATPIQNQTSASLMLQSIKLLEFLNFDINIIVFIVFAIGAFHLLKVPIWAFTIQEPLI